MCPEGPAVAVAASLWGCVASRAGFGRLAGVGLGQVGCETEAGHWECQRETDQPWDSV